MESHERGVQAFLRDTDGDYGADQVRHRSYEHTQDQINFHGPQSLQPYDSIAWPNASSYQRASYLTSKPRQTGDFHSALRDVVDLDGYGEVVRKI